MPRSPCSGCGSSGGASARRSPAAKHAARPAVTIFKPAHGDEPRLEANLASFCAQDYPHFDVVFGVLDPADPALAVMRRVAARYPGRASVVSGDGVARYRNPKMATLQPMIASARGDILVIADSDMRVGPDYLDAIVAPFADPRIGALTCVFGGEPADDGSRRCSPRWRSPSSSCRRRSSRTRSSR